MDNAGEETVDIFNKLEEIQNKIDDYMNIMMKIDYININVKKKIKIAI